jgi:chromosome segregation ATPase
MMFGKDKTDDDILAVLEKEMQTLEACTTAAQQRQHELNYLAQRDALEARKTYSFDDMGQLSRERAKLKAESEALDIQIARNNYQMEEAKANYVQLRERRDGLSATRERLFREMGECRNDEETLALRERLLPVLKTLALYSNDQKAIGECEKLQREISSARSYIVNDRCLYHTADKTEIVEENDPRARWTAYGKGVHIPRDEARRLGLIPKEAQHEHD